MKQIFIIQGVDSEDAARAKAIEWYAHKPNFCIDSVKPSKHGGYQVSISYGTEDVE